MLTYHKWTVKSQNKYGTISVCLKCGCKKGTKPNGRNVFEKNGVKQIGRFECEKV